MTSNRTQPSEFGGPGEETESTPEEEKEKRETGETRVGKESLEFGSGVETGPKVQTTSRKQDYQSINTSQSYLNGAPTGRNDMYGYQTRQMDWARHIKRMCERTRPRASPCPRLD